MVAPYIIGVILSKKKKIVGRGIGKNIIGGNSHIRRVVYGRGNSNLLHTMIFWDSFVDTKLCVEGNNENRFLILLYPDELL